MLVMSESDSEFLTQVCVKACVAEERNTMLLHVLLLLEGLATGFAIARLHEPLTPRVMAFYAAIFAAAAVAVYLGAFR